MANIISRNKKKIGAFVVFSLFLISVGFVARTHIDDLRSEVAREYQQELDEYVDRLRDAQASGRQKVEALKEDILDRLKNCESGDLELDDAPIILDTNGEISIGLFMFQRDTVIYYWEKFYGERISRKRAVEIAISEKARELAKAIIFEETGGIYNWKNCAHKEGLVPEITVIKKIQ